MPTAFVTGGTGCVGLNLIQELRARGWEVVACHRPSSNLELLRRFAPRLAVADIEDPRAVHAAMPHGPDAVFHLAASVNFWSRRNPEQTRVNVQGTRNVVEAALERRARRFIHMSSAAAFGPESGDVLDETTPSRAPAHRVNYFRTKWLAEQEVQRGIERGLPAIFINPANIIGPYDPSTWSRVFVLLQRRRIPFVPPGSAPFCHVRQVVLASLAALTRGEVGHRYLLAGTHASYRELFAIACELLGRRPPPVAPKSLFSALACLGAAQGRLTGREPDLTPELAHVLTMSFEIHSSKAERDLGYRPVPLRQMLEEAYEWMRGERLI